MQSGYDVSVPVFKVWWLCPVLAGQRWEVRERVAVWSRFMRLSERMETQGAPLPGVGLEGRIRTECSSKEGARAAIHT